MTTLRHAAVCAAGLYALVLSSSCRSEGESPPDPTCGGQAPFVVPGAFASGVTTLDVSGNAVEVFYPAETRAAEGRAKARYDMRDFLPASSRPKIPDADAAFFEMDAYRDLPVSRARRFPVVLFSHGLGGFRLQSSFLASHLASWGFVVVAPEHPERNMAAVLEDLSKVDDKSPDQLRAALTRMRGEDAKQGGAFGGTLDLSKIAAMGHSMGGAATANLLDDKDIRAAVYLASGGFGEGTPGKPILMMAGTGDGVAVNLDQAFAKQPEGKRFVAIRDAGHLAFTDICAIGEDRGGVLEIAKTHGVPVGPLVAKLARDGCEPDEDLPYAKAWPVVRHFVTASLASALAVEPLYGQGGAPRGLGPEAASCFGDRVSSFEEK